MPLYFSYDPEGDGFSFHLTKEAAKEACENDLAQHRELASEGWSESVGCVCWGEIKEAAYKVNEMNKEEAEHACVYFNDDFDSICDYELQPT